MKITKLTEHQIRNWPAERVKVFVDSEEYDPWDLSPLKIEKKALDIADYSSICGRYVVKRFRTIDNLIEFMHEEQDSSEMRLKQLRAREREFNLLLRHATRNLLLASTTARET